MVPAGNSKVVVAQEDLAEVSSVSAASDDEAFAKKEGNLGNEAHGSPAGADGGEVAKSKQNRNEKRARKQLLKLGLKLVTGIEKVIIEKKKHAFFVVNKPDVYQVHGTQTFIIFGEAKVEDSTAQSQTVEAARRYVQTQEMFPTGPINEYEADDSKVEEVFDETGLSAANIELVMSQARCTRAEAIKALRETDDVVDAILNVTKT